MGTLYTKTDLWIVDRQALYFLSYFRVKIFMSGFLLVLFNNYDRHVIEFNTSMLYLFFNKIFHGMFIISQGLKYINSIMALDWFMVDNKLLILEKTIYRKALESRFIFMVLATRLKKLFIEQVSSTHLKLTLINLGILTCISDEQLLQPSPNKRSVNAPVLTPSLWILRWISWQIIVQNWGLELQQPCLCAGSLCSLVL